MRQTHDTTCDRLATHTCDGVVQQVFSKLPFASIAIKDTKITKNGEQGCYGYDYDKPDAKGAKDGLAVCR